MRRHGFHPRKAARAAVAMVCVAMAGVAVAACGSSPSASSPSRSESGSTIVLYSGQHEQTTDALVAGFEKATGIAVEVRSDDEDTLADEIVTEGSHTPADVIYTENSLPLEYLQKKGLLAKVDPSTLDHTPARYDSPQGDWVGVSARVSVIIYNPSLIKKSELPRSVLALAEPRYRGELAFAPPETDFQPVITSVERADGKAAALRWLEGIKANATSHLYPDNETIADEVNRGVVAFGVVNQYYWYRMRAEIGASNMHSKITYFSPHNPGYVLDISGAGILRSSKHKKSAQQVQAYLVSKSSQEIIANPSRSISFEYPIASGVTTMAPETPFDKLQPVAITVGQLGDGASAVALLKQAGLL